MKRPSIRELNKKLTAAKEAIKKKNYIFVDGEKVVGELIELNIVKTEEVFERILVCLDEIKPEDYEGRRPPERSY